MQITINEKKSDQFANEIVNVFYQNRGLVKNPEAKLKNSLGELKTYIAIGAVLFLLMGGMAILWGAEALTIIAMVLMVLIIAISLRLYFRLSGMAKVITSDPRSSVLTVDETGLTLARDGSEGQTLPWENVAFVRCFAESVCALPNDQKGYILAVPIAHKDEVLAAVKMVRPDTTIIGA